MSIQIKQKIVDYAIVEDEPESAAAATQAAAAAQGESKPAPKPAAAPKLRPAADGSNITRMHEKVERPEMLVGSTYKIKTPVSEHAFYITINDMLLNPGTPYEKRRPFEMFINSKNMDHYQWISALTLIVSAVFRKGGDVTFLVKELQSVFDPKGGYFRRGGKFMPSLVAEIGYVIEDHLKIIGLIKAPMVDKHQREIIEQKRRKFEQQQALKADPTDEPAFPDGAELCAKCHTKAMIVMDNCLTCLNCGESKCS